MKKFLLSTALIAATGSASLVQDAGATFRTQADPMEIHASNFIGMRVYSSEQQIEGDAFNGVQTDWEDVGEINDVILTRNGEVAAVLVDVGGFLGIDERQVAVEMNSISFVSDNATADDESDFFLVMNAPRTSLEEAPAYEWHSNADSMKIASEETATVPMGNAEAETMSCVAYYPGDAEPVRPAVAGGSPAGIGR